MQTFIARFWYFVLSIFGVISCSPGPSEHAHYVDVVIYIDDQWPSDKELDIRNEITDVLDRNNIGDWIESGSGMGTVQFTYLTERPKEDVEEIIKLTIERFAPGSEYEITFEKYEKPPGLAPDYVPPFAPGTCLATRLYPGGYGAAIVLNTRKGLTLVGGLRGVHETPPSIEICEQKDWLFLTHHNHKNQVNRIWCDDRDFEGDSDWFEVIGKVALTKQDPITDRLYGEVGLGPFRWIENQTWLQDKWDKDESR